jgi:hypothetical protein
MSSVFRRIFALLAACAMTGAFGASVSLAGTTGSLAGTVVDAKSQAPLGGVRVDASSPSQAVSTTTDANGRFTFISLNPDTYALTLGRSGYERLVAGGITVQADQQLSQQFALQPSLQQIGHVTSRSPLDLVKPGTTNDVYSVGPAVAAAAAPLGGGGALNSAYSAIASVPGVFVPPGQQGVNQSVFIRGGYYDQIGYEYDGVPMNRSFDNYPAHAASTLGQQELQVYTGGGGAGASATGLSGFINQVVRTGTRPPFLELSGRLGTPSFDHDLRLETGGMTPSRSFSYYVGGLGSNQSFRYFDQYNGADQTALFPNAIGPSNQTTRLDFYPAVYPNCTSADAADGNYVADPFRLGPAKPGGLAHPPYNFRPGCFAGMNPAYASISDIHDRQAVGNFHWAVPHRDGGHDDVQLLYNASAQFRQYYSGLGDLSPDLQQYVLGKGNGIWPDRITYPAGTQFLSLADVTPIAYPFPGSPNGRCYNTDITVNGTCTGDPSMLPGNYRDARWDQQNMLKLQYQKNIGTGAYVRIFGYSEYDNTNRSGAARRALGSGFGVANYDYEVDTHKTGADLQFGAQVTDKHLLTGTIHFETENELRVNNFNYLNFGDTQTTNLTNGSQCFDPTTGARAACNDPVSQGTFATPTYVDGSGNAQPVSCAGNAGATNPIPAAACAAGAAWRVTYTGNQAGLNSVKPHTLAAAIADDWKPTERLNVSLGMRFERDQYDLSNTNTPGKNFWFSAAQQEYCYNPVTLQPVFLPQAPQDASVQIPFVGFNCPVDSSSGSAVQTVHPDGQNGHLLLSNVYNPVLSQSYFLPRLGLTYTVDRDTVLRFSAGRYVQQPQAYEVQYNSIEENLANQLIGFFPYGFTTPRHDALPQYSNNFDFSYEHHFKGTDSSIKLTPYFRWATNQLYTVSVYGQSPALNTGIERSRGIELQYSKGDFNRNGLALQFSYTYLDSKEKWANFAGTNRNPVDPYNDYIQQYNALTRAGGGAPCYANSADVTPDPACGSSSIVNPYYNSAPQQLFDKNAWYETGLDFPYLSPNVFALVLNYRHDRFAITPALSLNQGSTYGTPADVVGVDPRTCVSNQGDSGFTTGNPQNVDYTSCNFAATPSGTLYVPNPETGHFDRFGEFRQPWQLNLGLQMTYDVSKRVTASMVVTNLFNRCFGGSSTPWSRANPPSGVVCGYQSNPFYINNFYNGSSPNDTVANGVPLNPYFAHSFAPSYADVTSFGYASPLNVYFQLKLRL